MNRRALSFEPRFDAWRDEARRLLAEGVPPDAVEWLGEGEETQQALFPGLDAPSGGSPEPSRSISVPKAFVGLAHDAACYRDPERWPILYRVLWRLVRGDERHLLAVEVDPDVHRLRSMQKAVRRDSHKMKAFVRFRRVEQPGPGGENETWYVAWHRPDHHIVERVAPFFVERFNDQRWAILTPDASARWDLSSLDFGPGVARTEAPQSDELESLWTTYYASIFNPARLKLKAMKAEMPVKHWGTLPEARLLPELIRDAPRREREMLRPRRPPATSFFPESRTLVTLADAVEHCEACALCEGMGRAVFGEGPADAALVVVGEQPGDQEERAGRPFVGPAGRVLDAALESAGLDRSRLYLTNAVKHFRHEKRADERGNVRRIHKTPGQTEVSSCRPWLGAELEIVRPRGIVCLGVTAARAVLGPTVRLKDVRGRFHELDPDDPDAPWVLVTYHPSATLRQRDEESRHRVESALRADLATVAEKASVC